MSQELEGTLTNSANLTGTFGSEGGGGTSNYNDLINKPSINSVTLQGNKTASQLGFAEVATSGNYNDLNNKPTIPAAQVNSDWNSTSGVSEILNKPTLASVATSGDYDDLTNKPTIPAAQVNSDWNSTSGVSEILNKPTVYQNAAELPISANDSTDTKSYIDTGLSGKQNTISDSGWINLPLASGVSNYGDLISCYRKIGNVVYYYILVEKSGLGWGSQVASLPTGYRPNQEATSSGRYGNGICNFSIATNGIINFLASTNTSTTDYRFFACGSFCI